MNRALWYSSVLILLLFSPSYADTSNERNFIKILELSPDPSIPLKSGSEVRIKVKIEYSIAADSALINLLIQKDDSSGSTMSLIGNTMQTITKGSGTITLEKAVTVPDTSVLQVFTPLMIPGQTSTSTVDFRFYRVEKNAEVKKVKVEDARQITERARKHNEALNKCLDYGAPSTYKIASLLFRRDYQGLEKLFDTMLQQYEQDAQYECYLDESFETFNQRNFALKDLDAWVAATKSSTAYAARGMYRANQGFDAKGYMFKSEALQAQKNEMQLHFDEAAKDLQTAANKSPSLMPAYTWLIKLAKATHMPYSAKQIVQKAEEKDKRSFSVRSAYMESLQPRWGGSLEEMESFAAQVAPLADLNPRLWSLQGETDAIRAANASRTKNNALAVELYSSALRYGDIPRLFRWRSFVHSSLGQNELARTDMEKFRTYALRDTKSYVPGSLADTIDLNFEISDKSYVDPKIGKSKIRSYLVLPVERLNPSSDFSYTDIDQRAARRITDRIELTLMRLGSECVDRGSLNSILEERAISPASLTHESAQTVGRVMRADAVIIATNSQRVYHSTRTYVKDIDIKAVSVSTGKVLWKSLLKGSVVIDQSLVNFHELIFDTEEAKLFKKLEETLLKEMNH